MLSQTLTVLSGMITPVVLILASGSLILTTSQRLGRVIERTRKLTERLKDVIKATDYATQLNEEGSGLFQQLQMATQRARLLQLAMTSLYATLSVFVATSVAIGIIDIMDADYVWIPVLLGFAGACTLFFASMILIRESRIAIRAVDHEMDGALQFFYRHLPDMPREQRRKWWNKILKIRAVLKPFK